MLEYKEIKVKQIRQIILTIKIYDSKNILSKIINFSKDIAKKLKSEILSQTIVEFPKNNYTYLAVLSTSHIAISTYFADEKYLDIDIAWCSGQDANIEDFKKILKKNFGKYEIIYYKGLNRRREFLI